MGRRRFRPLGLPKGIEGVSVLRQGGDGQGRDRGQWEIGYTSLTQRATLSGSMVYFAHNVGQIAEGSTGLAGDICHVVICPLKCMGWGHDGGPQGVLSCSVLP